MRDRLQAAEIEHDLARAREAQDLLADIASRRPVGQIGSVFGERMVFTG